MSFCCQKQQVTWYASLWIIFWGFFSLLCCRNDKRIRDEEKNPFSDPGDVLNFIPSETGKSNLRNGVNVNGDCQRSERANRRKKVLIRFSCFPSLHTITIWTKPFPFQLFLFPSRNCTAFFPSFYIFHRHILPPFIGIFPSNENGSDEKFSLLHPPSSWDMFRFS